MESGRTTTQEYLKKGGDAEKDQHGVEKKNRSFARSKGRRHRQKTQGENAGGHSADVGCRVTKFKLKNEKVYWHDL